MSEGHEIFTPDDDERLSRVETSLVNLNVMLRGDRATRNKGFITETDERLSSIETKIVDVKDLSKQIKTAIWALVIGVVISLVIFGVITIKDAISYIK